MLTARTDVERSRLKRLIGFRFFHADSSKVRELCGVLLCECRGHVLHENHGGREVSREAGSDPHDGGRPSCGRCEHDYREALIESGSRRGAIAYWRGRRSLGAAGILNRQGQA